MNLKNKILLALLGILPVMSVAQDKKVWASGAARSIFQQNNLTSAGDTITPKRLNSGHTLVDLAVNAKPNDQTFIHGMVRIRNDFGGFWNSGVTFDIRQLYVKGLVKDAIRYQLGDINYKLTPYTFYSQSEELSGHQTEILNIYRDITQYDMFFSNDNTWRQQGAAVDFTLDFTKIIKEANVNLFASRNRPSDFNQQSDRIFLGGNANITIIYKLKVGVNYIDLMDVAGTARTNKEFHNPVISGTTEYSKALNGIDLRFQSESGVSQMYELNGTSPALKDYFVDLKLQGILKKIPINFGFNYINVGPQFRSIGAQTKRVNFSGQNRLYSVYGLNQQTRAINSADLLQDAALYQLSFNPDLDDYNPAFQNIQPYGTATPNRKGLILNINHESKTKSYELGATYKNLSEVVGQGTIDLRKFSEISANGILRIHKLLSNYKNILEISTGVSSGVTKRTTAFPLANVDLSNLLADFGFKVGMSKNLDLLLNYRIVNAKGIEFKSVRGSFTEVIDFDKYETQLSEKLLVVAMRYSFSEKNKLNLVWQKINWEDSKSGKNNYGMSQFAVVYSLMF